MGIGLFNKAVIGGNLHLFISDVTSQHVTLRHDVIFVKIRFGCCLHER